MSSNSLFAVSAALMMSLAVAQGSPAQSPADRLIDAAVGDSAAYRRLALLVDTFGNRPSGSESLERAIDWIVREMKKDGLENVHTEPVMVTHWVRGRESATLVSPRRMSLHMLGLGRSVGTPAGGITAPVLVVGSFADLRAHAAAAKGKIVVYDVPFDTSVAPFTGYSHTVVYRGAGADSAAQFGAVAALVRSVTPRSLRTPHTGGMSYGDTTAGARHIPAAAVSVEDAELLHRMQDRGEKPVVNLTMGARTLPKAPSRNIVAEIRGSEKPDEIIVLGGHIDSWDVGQGAMDDGGGSVAAWEAVRLIKQLGLRPRRTIRVVLWTNEEIGLAGGNAYRDAHRSELPNHVLALESDNGVFTPRGIDVISTDAALPMLQRIVAPLARVGVASVRKGDGPEADISPIVALGVPAVGLDTDGSRYFWYHHTDADTIDKLDPHDVALCVATMSVIAYGVSEMDGRLPAPAR